MTTNNFFKISLLLAFTALIMSSCDDDYQDVGSGMFPDEDNIFMSADYINLEARTVSIGNKTFVRSSSVMLGSLIDSVFGRIKADYMGQFFLSNPSFSYGHKGINDISIDSVRMHMLYTAGSFLGDPKSSTGVSIYELNSQLTPDFYIDVKPENYCDKSILWGQRIFTEDELDPIESGLARLIEIEIDTKVGQRIFDKWAQDTLSGKKETVLYNTDTFKNFIKGIYVTSTFNDKSLIKFPDANSAIAMNIYYSYHIKTKDEKSDSLVHRYMPLPLGAEALVLNSVETPDFNSLEISKNTEKDRTYIQALSGIVAEITIPLKEIKEKGKEKTKTDEFALNSALLNFVGMTEAEDKLMLKDKPSSLLFINADSIDNYFYEGKKPDGQYSLLISRQASNNSYYFNSALNFSSSVKNIANIINNYLNKDEEEQVDEVKYLLIPISVTSTSDNYGQALVGTVSNTFAPAAAILRTSEKYMKVPLLFSKFAEKEKPENKE